MIGRPRRRGRAVTLALGLVVLAVAAWMLVPLAPPRFPRHRGAPARDAGAAMAALMSMPSATRCELSPLCRTQVLAHGRRTGRVVVMLHGLTNCPQQFRALGERLHAEGANVVIPTLPRHGCADRMSEALEGLTALELTRFTDRVLDAARGLGDTMIVVGLSLGAVMAAWAAQERPDVAHAVVIAPLIGLGLVPDALTPGVVRTFRLMPNRFLWWDPRVREQLPGPKHVYPRWATRAVGETMWLGAAVQSAAGRRAPRAPSLAMVTVGGDPAVNNAAAAALARDWRRHGAEVAVHEFPASAGLNHDIIDPEQVRADPERIYPVLMPLILPGR